MGQKIPIPLVGPAYLNVDPLSLKQGAALLVNGYIDEQGSLCGRPGLAAWKTIAHGAAGTIRGFYWWVEQQRMIAVIGGKVYALASKTGEFALISGSVTVDGTDPIVFATNGTWLYMAGGGHIYRWNLTTFAQETDAVAPTSCSHLVYMDGYIIANKKTTQLWWWAEPGALPTDPLVFSASSLSAESNPDPIQAIMVGWRELYFIGSRSVDVFINDGNPTTVFARLDGAIIEKGCIAPYSVQKVDNSIIWLDDTKRVVQLTGREPVPISQALDRVITNLTSPWDARSTIVDVGSRKFYLLSFPTNGRTFAYDLLGKQWAEWGMWDTGTELYTRFIGEMSLTVPEWGGMRLIASTASSETPAILVVSHGFQTDSGNLIRPCFRTIHHTFGTSNRKRADNFSISMKRGESEAADSLGILTSTGVPFSPDPGPVTEPEYGGDTDETVVPDAPSGLTVNQVSESLAVPASGTAEVSLGLVPGDDYICWLVNTDPDAGAEYDVSILDSVTEAAVYEYLNLDAGLTDNNYFIFTATDDLVLRISNRTDTGFSCDVLFKFSKVVTV
jgi:hypothetical protein